MQPIRGSIRLGTGWLVLQTKLQQSIEDKSPLYQTHPIATGKAAMAKNSLTKLTALLSVLFTFMLLKGTWSLDVSLRRQSDEEELLKHLFDEYNPSARPVINSSETATVNIQFSMLQIQDLNVRNQVFTTTGMLILDWEDQRLTWDADTSPVDEFVIDGNNIWRPEFAVINGAEAIYGAYTEFQALVRSDGTVRWEPGGVFKTMCQIDITYYPFDSQLCELNFGAWSYFTTKMNLTTNSTDINLDKFESNGEWAIDKTEVERREFNFECCPDQRFSNVAFKIYLRRKHNFYIMNVILPCIMTSAVLLSIFFCTPSQKVHIGVASLLSFRLFLVNVADTIPRTSDHVPLLGIYLTCTMAITTLAMVATVFVLNLHNIRDKPVPPWLYRIFITYLSRVLCMCNVASSKRLKQEDKKHQPSINRLVNTPEQSTLDTEMACEYRVDAKTATTGQATCDGPKLRHVVRSGKQTHAVEQIDYTKEWVHVASVCDRLFFWLCLLVIVATTFVLFYPLITSLLFYHPTQ